MKVKSIIIFVTLIIVVDVSTSATSYVVYSQKSNLTDLAPNLESSRNVINSTSMEGNVQNSNITDVLESILNQSITTKSKDKGYVCVLVPSSVDPNGYQCEPCALFPSLCPDVSKLNKTRIN